MKLTTQDKQRILTLAQAFMLRGMLQMPDSFIDHLLAFKLAAYLMEDVELHPDRPDDPNEEEEQLLDKWAAPLRVGVDEGSSRNKKGGK